MLSEEQSKKYIEEARLSLESARAIFDGALRAERELWANVVKMCYDSMEQAVSAAIAKKDEIIPKDHPAKIAKFVNLYGLSNKSDISKILFSWLSKRSSSQYVDIKNGKIAVPHELFNEGDAEEAIDDARIVISLVGKMLEKRA